MLPTTGTNRTSRTAKRAIAATGLLGLGLALPCITATTASAAPVSVWDKVAACESTNDWSINTGNGFYGGLQFTSSTWAAYGGTQYAPEANQATKDQQISVAEKVLADQGPGAWPVCSIEAGLTAGGAPADVNPGGSAQSAPAQQAAPAQAPQSDQSTQSAPSTQGNSGGQGGDHHGRHHNAQQPAAQAQSYTVVAGDWLSTIAQKHDVQGGWQKLYDLNKSVLTQGPDVIYPGEQLVLAVASAPVQQSSDDSTAPAQAPATPVRTASVQTAAPAQATGSMAAAVNFAESKVGQAYVWGGSSNGGWDCSGLTQAALAQAGISIPRVAADQAAVTTRVSLDSLQPGDLLFWSNDGTDAGVYHVGIYIGNGQYVEAANPSAGVKFETISNYTPDFAGRV
ncbi:transglycosylase family protein [Kitasatospora viridis]|uniref:Cell wall-associated NlpC family hydrolase n=1 Tax=Kitasatospora viridis TaxID=281105 RepID=A0A561UNY9_9ACTN|nr:transglycosylase family protein [Kitasatospora viridis]TWG01070.1 cell wall-associated NlpC family hydrolase [Kitasatospora viridis]